jgi:hypothetical protein
MGRRLASWTRTRRNDWGAMRSMTVSVMGVPSCQRAAGSRWKTYVRPSAEASQLAAAGVRELNLVAQDATAFGKDRTGRPNLAGLLRALDQVEGLDWIRQLYLYPTALTDELIKAMCEEGFRGYVRTLRLAQSSDVCPYDRLVRGAVYPEMAPHPLTDCVWVYRDSEGGYFQKWGSGCPG